VGDDADEVPLMGALAFEFSDAALTSTEGVLDDGLVSWLLFRRGRGEALMVQELQL
jgi:hypothetical protein